MNAVTIYGRLNEDGTASMLGRARREQEGEPAPAMHTAAATRR